MHGVADGLDAVCAASEVWVKQPDNARAAAAILEGIRILGVIGVQFAFLLFGMTEMFPSRLRA
jgi:hypothetical protein